MKIALIVGHNARSQGAVRVTDGRSEFDWCADLANAIAASAPALYRVFRRPSGLSYGAEIRQAYAPISKSEFAATIELHFNSVASPAATGTETLTSGTLGSLRLARLIQPAMVGALGLRDRGLVTRKRDDRGGESLWAGAPPAILIEPFFGSNPGDCAAVDRQFSALARAIHGACAAHLKGV